MKLIKININNNLFIINNSYNHEVITISAYNKIKYIYITGEEKKKKCHKEEVWEEEESEKKERSLRMESIL